MVKEIIMWMGMLGTPTLFAVLCWCVSLYNKISILMKAVQAQMRRDLLKQYYDAKERGYISSDDLDEWINQYNSYHALGKNGVLDKRKDELLTMPTKLEE